MNLRSLNIGARLGWGFGLILLVCGALLASVLVVSDHVRADMLQQMQAASERTQQAKSMQAALLSSAVSVRNMGLQTEVDAVQRDEAEAKAFRAAFMAERERLEAAQLGGEEQAALKRLAAIDAKTNEAFLEAVGFAGTFNPEQAAAVITKKMDPLLKQANTELAIIIKAQTQRQIDVQQAADDRVKRAELSAAVAGVVVLLASLTLAWRLTLSITQPLQAAELASAKVAQGALDFDIDTRGTDEAARLLRGVAAMRDGLAQVVSSVRMNSESVATASSEIAQGNNDLSSRTEQQASALQQTAASMDQLGSAVRHNADNARHANELAQGAASVASEGGEVVGRVVQTMKGINESSRRISDIIGTIDGIAFQTNILALNAAVEAARAGEQGRGFAVVAGEVRSLAQRSAAAAKEIKTLISDSVERVEQGCVQVDKAGETMTQIAQAIDRVTRIMGEISHASAEQDSSVTQVCRAVTQMDLATQQNAALVEQSAAAAESLKGQAAELVQTVAVFKLAAHA
ncbi:methyl-accepting chemotaxis protein [Ideonella margarita]|uniref:Methyl-accepting chemotaxis protein n=1 Tax=Ideonella margarita TaxID=2984191 RepID=A0ABU9C3K3_9BURK